MPAAACLAIFAKEPIPGRVKTRLARHIGAERAAQVYAHLLDYTRTVADALAGADRIVFYADAPPAVHPFAGAAYRVGQQLGGDLGARMHGAFAECAAAGYERVVLIGSDCRALTTDLLATAFRQLDTHDAVLGPATDGGYYLIGLRAPQPTLFADVTWSTAQVLPQTRARLAAAHLTHAELITLSDVDEPVDLTPYPDLLALAYHAPFRTV